MAFGIRFYAHKKKAELLFKNKIETDLFLGIKTYEGDIFGNVPQPESKKLTQYSMFFSTKPFIFFNS